MVILVDTNVILDFLTVRQPYYNDARDIFHMCAEEKLEGYLAFHSLPNIFYILRKSHTEADRRRMLKKVCLVLKVTGAGHERVCAAIENNKFSDFEDCLQDECAQEIFADYIVTRNAEDFLFSKVKAVTPQNFLEIAKSQA